MVIVICNYDLEQLQHQSTMALLSLKDSYKGDTKPTCSSD